MSFPHGQFGLVYVIASALALATSTMAAEVFVLEASFPPQGRVADGPFAEEGFSVDPSVVETLRMMEPGDRLLLSEFPVDLGVREPVRLKRASEHPGRFLVIDEGDVSGILLPSGRFFFSGRTDSLLDTRIALTFDPATDRLTGTIWRAGKLLELAPRPEVRSHSLRPVDSDAASTFACGNEVAGSRVVGEPFPPALLSSSMRQRAAGLREALIAVDTDVEFVAARGGANAARDWIEDLFNSMNVLYERDLDLHLTRGDTFIRVNSDPYSVTGSPASGNHLFEFRNHWQSNLSSVDRDFAMLISGKSSSAFSASGIAFVDSFCSTSSGYSVNQVFWDFPASSSASLVAHELGHNLGSPHTHCYDPPVDQCWPFQGGCFSGNPVCPAGGKGTLMSYCHLSSGAGCGSNKFELHPTVESLMRSRVAANYPSCISDYGGTSGIFSDGFESGGLGAWN